MVDIVVIGGGPAGLAASIQADKCGASVMLIEREARLGGILKQCIHDGFGVVRFGEKLSGTEYAQRFIDELNKTKVETQLFSFVTRIEKIDDGYRITYVNTNGVQNVECRKLILSTGCRERTRNQISVTGDRGAGVFTAGSAQHLVNISGIMPTKKCVILGSGDIGLIMARRLTLEGAKVVGVYEAKPTPSGLTRNIHQCLHDFNIPLYLSKTVTRVIGNDRITAVEVSSVDNNMKPIGGTSEIIECDSLILAVGLIPENEIAEKLSVPIDRKTKGPIVDQTMCTLLDGIYSCGNALHVNDLVDYVSESAEIAGKYASEEVGKRSLVDVNIDENFLYIVPQKLNVNKPCDKTVLFFRSKDNFTKKILTISVDGAIVLQKKYAHLLPPEMERLVVDLSCVKADSKIELTLTD